MAMTASPAPAPMVANQAPKAPAKPQNSVGDDADAAVGSGERGDKASFSDLVDGDRGETQGDDSAAQASAGAQSAARATKKTEKDVTGVEAPASATIASATPIAPEVDADILANAETEAMLIAGSQANRETSAGATPAAVVASKGRAAASPLALPLADGVQVEGEAAPEAPGRTLAEGDAAEATGDIKSAAAKAAAEGRVEGRVTANAATSAPVSEAADEAAVGTANRLAVKETVGAEGEARPALNEKASPAASLAHAHAPAGEGGAGKRPGQEIQAAVREAIGQRNAVPDSDTTEEAPRLAPRVEPLAAAKAALAAKAPETQTAVTLINGGSAEFGASQSMLDPGADPAGLAQPGGPSGVHGASGDMRAALQAPVSPRDPAPIMAQIATATRGAGRDRIEVRLDPPELGNVTLRFHFRDDAVAAVVAADRAETAELLRRHGEELQRALKDSGFGDVSLDFSGGEGPKRGFEGYAAGRSSGDADVSKAAIAQPAAPRRVLDGLDIRV